MKLFRTLSTIDKTHKNKQKIEKIEATLLGTQQGIHLDPKKSYPLHIGQRLDENFQQFGPHFSCPMVRRQPTLNSLPLKMNHVSLKEEIGLMNKVVQVIPVHVIPQNRISQILLARARNMRWQCQNLNVCRLPRMILKI